MTRTTPASHFNGRRLWPSPSYHSQFALSASHLGQAFCSHRSAALGAPPCIQYFFNTSLTFHLATRSRLSRQTLVAFASVPRLHWQFLPLRVLFMFVRLACLFFSLDKFFFLRVVVARPTLHASVDTRIPGLWVVRIFNKHHSAHTCALNTPITLLSFLSVPEPVPLQTPLVVLFSPPSRFSIHLQLAPSPSPVRLCRCLRLLPLFPSSLALRPRERSLIPLPCGDKTQDSPLIVLTFVFPRARPKGLTGSSW